MSDAPDPTAPGSAPPPEGAASADPEPGPARPSLARRLWRHTRRTVAVVLGVVVALLVGVFAIDLGPSLRGLTERQASRLIQRPVHIGGLSVRLLSGRFVFRDFVIEGLAPADRPFFVAKTIDVDLPWWTIATRDLVVRSVTLSDWHMLVETFPGDRHTFIKLPKRDPNAGPRRFTTTVRLVRAVRGEFVFEDHGAPWGTVARNLDLTIEKREKYQGRARFTHGTVSIQKFEPMSADMSCSFVIDGGMVLLDRIDLLTDGAVSKVTGEVDIGHWPEQTYHVDSAVDFRRMKDIFFAGQNFTLHGEGRFRGTFHLFKGGRDLTGSFTSAELGINSFRFPRLAGKLRWLPDRFEVTDATSELYGGRSRFSYTMAPLGRPEPAFGRLDATYEDVDLLTFTDFMELRGIRLDGRASGRNLLEWPLGRFAEHRGEGHVVATAPAGVTPMPREMPDAIVREHVELGPEYGPFNPQALLAPVPIAGELTYGFGPEWIDVGPSHVATPRTFVEFEGRTAWGDRSRLAFHVTSGDWQESDRFLAGIISAFGSETHAVPVGGYGTFDGVMTGPFKDPRVEGRFEGDAMRAWEVTWGRIGGDVVIEDQYARVTSAHMRNGDGEMDIDGDFSIGYPRKDRGEEINARINTRQWPLVDLRHAFNLDDYPVDGRLSGDFHLFDKYTQPQGFGRLTIENGVAYGEAFDTGTAGMRFEGSGVRLDAIEIDKDVGQLTGAAFIGWNGTYSFNADGQRFPIEALNAFRFEGIPLTGQLQFSARGTGTFESPRYDVRARIDDLYLGDEGIGLLTSRFTVADRQLTLDQFEVASPRLAVSGNGRIALTPEADAELTFRFSDTSLDPYVRALRPGLSPFTTAVATGTLRVLGELENLPQLRAEAVVDAMELRLFDYSIRNDGPLRLTLENETMRIDRLRFVGDGTQIELAGDAGITSQRLAIRGLGDANLGILQGFLRDVRSSGAAEVQVDVRGTFEKPLVYGSVNVLNGRIRHFALPHAIEALNGRFEFDAGGIRLDNLSGRLGGGPVRFEGRIGFTGLWPSEYNITAAGTDMRLRYPQGFRSVVDADLALRGDVYAPVLSGNVNVRSSVWSGAIDTAGTGIFGIAAAGGPELPAPADGEASAVPLRFDLRVNAPGTLRVENRAARLDSSAELTLRGTYDKPLLFGRVEILRGEVFFEGNRYQVTRGTIDFANPNRIEPFFDLEAETRARVPGQIYRVVFHVSGTPARFAFDLTSDPPLATVEILSLLFGDQRDPQNADIRALRSPGATEQELFASRAARLLASPISSNVERAVEETFGVDTVQITPSFGATLGAEQESLRLNPSARLTIGKRISRRLYLTYARALSASSRDQIILVEYDQSDRFSWVVSQNEDRTYAVDLRVRYVF